MTGFVMKIIESPKITCNFKFWVVDTLRFAFVHDAPYIDKAAYQTVRLMCQTAGTDPFLKND